MSSTSVTWRFAFSHPAHVVALGLGAGLSPLAPGTMGTVLAWVVYSQWGQGLGDTTWLLATALAFLVGWWACTVTASHMAQADPGAIVWDEILAFALVLWIAGPNGWGEQWFLFALFRFFDAAKPGPVRWADQVFKGDGWTGGFGILFDDLVAAMCTLLVFAFWRLWSAA